MDSLSFMFHTNTAPTQGLGLKAATHVLASVNPLSTLRRLVTSFPQYSHLLTSLTSSPELLASMPSSDIFSAPTPENYVTLNGLEMDLVRDDAFTILRKMRKERQLISQLKEQGFTTSQSLTLLSTSFKKPATALRFDTRSDAVLWWNDLEKDSRYKAWARTVGDYLQPFYPGRLRPIAKNLINVVFVLDLAQQFQLGVTLDLFEFIDRMVPVRWGMMTLNNGGTSDTMANITAFLVSEYSKASAKKFLVEIWKDGSNGNPLNIERIRSTLEKTVGATKIKLGDSVSFEQIQNIPSVVKSWKESREFCDRIQIGKDGAAFLNGEWVNFDEV